MSNQERAEPNVMLGNEAGKEVELGIEISLQDYFDSNNVESNHAIENFEPNRATRRQKSKFLDRQWRKSKKDTDSVTLTRSGIFLKSSHKSQRDKYDSTIWQRPEAEKEVGQEIASAQSNERTPPVERKASFWQGILNSRPCKGTLKYLLVLLILVVTIAPIVMFIGNPNETTASSRTSQFDGLVLATINEAEVLSCSQEIFQGNIATGIAFSEPACPDGDETSVSKGQWFKFKGNDMCVTLSTCNMNTFFDTRIRVYLLNAAKERNCYAGNNYLPLSSCSDQLGSSSITFHTDPGVQYFVLLDGASQNTSGEFAMSIDCHPCAPSPVPTSVPNESGVIGRDAGDPSLDPSQFPLNPRPCTKEHAVTKNATYARSVYAADINGDGKMDVLSASAVDNKIAWHENKRDGSDFVEHIVSTNAIGAVSVYAADINGDGKMDILSASGLDDKIAWYENKDDGSNFVEHIISTDADAAASVYAADIDGDGKIDVLYVSSFDNNIIWSQNKDDGSNFVEHIISNNTNSARSVYAADINNDGKMDILSASAYDDKIAWYEQKDDSSEFVEHIISTVSSFARSVHAADMNRDGKMDVLSASAGDDTIMWYENKDDGSNFVEHVISKNADGAASVYATDINGDGKIDVLSASSNDHKIAWYENIGDGFNFIEHVISTKTDYVRSVYAADIDGDGKMDVLSASLSDNDIAWFEIDSCVGGRT